MTAVYFGSLGATLLQSRAPWGKPPQGGWRISANASPQRKCR